MLHVEAGSVGHAGEKFVRNAWYGAMWAHELSPGELVPRTIIGEPLAFYRCNDGSVVALYDRCPHRFAPLTWGKVLPNDRIQCGYHGLEFNAAGTCVHNPYGNGNIPPSATVRKYPVVEKHRMIWVWTGDEDPDPAQIPDFSVIDDAEPVYVAELDHIRVAANYRLLIDNLLDPSHIAFLHAGSLGNADMATSAVIRVEHSDNEVELDWSAAGVPAPNILRQLLPANFPADHADFWTHERWLPPSTILLQSATCPAGADRSTGTGYYGVHILTPETSRSTLYHFTSVRWNPRADRSQDDAIRTALSVSRRDVFLTQDGPIIEAQQDRIDRAGAPLRPSLLAIDVAPVRYGNVLDRLIEQESTA